MLNKEDLKLLILQEIDKRERGVASPSLREEGLIEDICAIVREEFPDLDKCRTYLVDDIVLNKLGISRNWRGYDIITQAMTTMGYKKTYTKGYKYYSRADKYQPRVKGVSSKDGGMSESREN